MVFRFILLSRNLHQVEISSTKLIFKSISKWINNESWIHLDRSFHNLFDFILVSISVNM